MGEEISRENMNIRSQLSIPKLVIASANLGKVEEFQELLACLPFSVISQPKGIQVQEDGKTFAENARKKALKVASLTGEFSLSDDSGLSVIALGGLPGIHSARYASTDFERVKRLLAEMSLFKNRKAYFSAALCFASPKEGVLIEVEGRCEGVITNSPRGNNGFGYDPIFEVKGTGLTFAEMAIERKKLISHRGIAFQKLIPKLKKILDT